MTGLAAACLPACHVCCKANRSRSARLQVADMNAGVEKLGFNKIGGGILLVSWVVILVVVVVLVSGRLAGSGRVCLCACLHVRPAWETLRTLARVLSCAQPGPHRRRCAAGGRPPPSLPAHSRARLRTKAPRSCTGLPSSTAPARSSLAAARWCCPCCTTMWWTKCACIMR